MNRPSILNIKFVNFIIQITILSLFIFLFDYEFKINFDGGILKQRRQIIQFLANYVMYDSKNTFGITFIFLIWILAALIPVFNFDNYKSVGSTNLYTFFFPNFFFYIFLQRYSPNYFNLNFITFIMNSIILGSTLLLISIISSILLNKTIGDKNKVQIEDFKKIIEKVSVICPQCGMVFNSIPVYCFNCLKKLKPGEIVNDCK